MPAFGGDIGAIATKLRSHRNASVSIQPRARSAGPSQGSEKVTTRFPAFQTRLSSDACFPARGELDDVHTWPVTPCQNDVPPAQRPFTRHVLNECLIESMKKRRPTASRRRKQARLG